MSEEQLAFDIEGMLHEAAVESTPEWRGAPLHFTTVYYPPAELDAALDHWMFLHAHDKTHVNMWRHSITVPDNAQVAGHGFALYTTDLRCEPWKHADRHESCQCVGDLMYQAICEPCEWNAITDHENVAARPRAPRLARTPDRPVEVARDGHGPDVQGHEELDRRALPPSPCRCPVRQ